jgi:hypothetical protein
MVLVKVLIIRRFLYYIKSFLKVKYNFILINEGCVGYRDGDLGSIFGLAIAKALIKYAHEKELDDIFKEVSPTIG